MFLSLDIETYSDVDLTKCGVYAYADSPNFTILLLAYAFGDEETKIVDLACGEQLPREVLDALADESVIKTAFNAMFERTCLSRFLGIQLSARFLAMHGGAGGHACAAAVPGRCGRGFEY